MSVTSDLLYAYLREIFYGFADAKLDIDKLEDDYKLLAQGLMYFAQCVFEHNDYAKALAKGDLSVKPPPPENELAAPIKSLQASLKHLTWQSKQVAAGDYKQRVDYMGEFADGFNTMVEQLSDRQQKLEDEILVSQQHSTALEQSNLLLSRLTQHIPQQIFVVDVVTREILLTNNMAKTEMDNDPGYIDVLFSQLPDHDGLSGSYHLEIEYKLEHLERHLSVNAYLIEWNMTNAVALVIDDVSEEKKRRKELEDHAYHDSLTNAYNRFYGILNLNEWLSEKKRFALVFADLDHLKFINDRFGHSEGDHYLVTVAKRLRESSGNTMVCRVGGDEFMLIVPDFDFDMAHERMREISSAIEHDEYVSNKDYEYSLSFGIVAVDEDNEYPSSMILSMADERMYVHKRARKKERQALAQT